MLRPDGETDPERLASVALGFVGVREKGGDNRGEWVDRFNRALNESIGHAWCASFVAFCIRAVERERGATSPLRLSEHVMTLWRDNAAHRVAAGGHRVGDIAVWQKQGTGMGHCGIVVECPGGQQFVTVEGNTSDSSAVEREGDGVFRKRRRLGPMGSMVLVGFLRAFPGGTR